ncbi:unnamed protein product, partial [Owenia fusiformis]
MSSNRGGSIYLVPTPPNSNKDSAYTGLTGPRGEHFYSSLFGGEETIYPGLSGPKQYPTPAPRYDGCISEPIYAEIEDPPKFAEKEEPSRFAKLAKIIAIVVICVVIAIGVIVVGMYFAGLFTDTPVTTTITPVTT